MIGIHSTLDYPDTLEPWKYCPDTKYLDIQRFITCCYGKIHALINKGNFIVKSYFRTENPCPDPETKYPDKQRHLRRIDSSPSKTCPDTKNPDIWGPDNQGLAVYEKK